MALNVVHDSIDDIPEPHRELYTEKDGKFHLTGVAGVKTQTDVDALSRALVKERDEHKGTKDKFSVWGDLDHAETMKKLDRMGELEVAAAGKIEDQDAKLNEMTEARVLSRLAPVQRENDKIKKDMTELVDANQKFVAESLRRSIQDEIRSVAGEQKIIATAMPDVELLAQAVFERTEDGAFLTRENVFGVSAGLDAAGFFLEMQPKRPHWWPASEGGGAKGSGDGGGFANNPFSKDHWNMTEQGKLLNADRARAEAMAKAAGTTIGAPRPVTA